MQTKEMANRLTERREAAGLSQAALGAQVGVTKQAISDFELGEKMPSLATAAALARVLETTVDALFLGGESTGALDKSSVVADAPDVPAAVLAPSSHPVASANATGTDLEAAKES